MNDRRHDTFRIAFALCAAASAIPFLLTYRLPMTDLPQHAAQISLWKHYADPCYGLGHIYRKVWFTPYLLGYGIARGFAAVLSVNNALRLTAYLAVLAFAAGMRMLVRRAGLDPWLALLGFPLAFGFSFYWGFLNFIVALPIGIAFVALAYDYAQRQTAARAALLMTAGLLLLVSHGFVFAVCLIIALGMHLIPWRGARHALVTAWPYFVPLPFAVLWIFRIRATEQPVHIPPWWKETIARPLWFFTRLLANDWDPAAIGFALLFIVIVVLCGVRPTRDPRRWIAFPVCAALYLFAPAAAFGSAVLFQRFTVLAAVFALFALDPKPGPIARPLARALLLTAVLAWLGILAARFHQFDADARDFDRVVNAIPTNRRLLYLDVTPGSDALPGVPFLHFAAYYQQRRGGVISTSFASQSPQLIRYRPGADPRASFGIEWEPRVFNWRGNDSRFDFFLVRAPLDMHDIAFRQATEPVVLLRHEGMWWLYAKQRAPRHDLCMPFEPDDAEARSWQGALPR